MKEVGYIILDVIEDKIFNFVLNKISLNDEHEFKNEHRIHVDDLIGDIIFNLVDFYNLDNYKQIIEEPHSLDF